MSGRARLSVFGGGASELRIEQKLITIQVDAISRGGLVEIIERNRFRSYSLKIDLGGVSWAIKALRQVWGQHKDRSFFSKYTSSSAVFLVQKFSNKGGIFAEMSKWEAGVKRSNIIIPAGADGQRWQAMATMLERIIHGGFRVLDVERNVRSTDKGGHNNKNQFDFSSRKGDSEGNRSILQETGANRAVSYADVLKSRSNSLDGNNFFLEIRKMVVCTRMNFFDEWAQIEKELNRSFKTSIVLRPFQLNKAMFFAQNSDEADYYGTQGVCFFHKSIAVRLDRWSEEVFSKDVVIASNGDRRDFGGSKIKGFTKPGQKEVLSAMEISGTQHGEDGEESQGNRHACTKEMRSQLADTLVGGEDNGGSARVNRGGQPGKDNCTGLGFNSNGLGPRVSFSHPIEVSGPGLNRVIGCDGGCNGEDGLRCRSAMESTQFPPCDGSDQVARAIRILSPTHRELNTEEIHLGLADVVDRSVGDLQRFNEGPETGIQELMEVIRTSEKQINEVEEGHFEIHEVLQNLEEYGSSASSESRSKGEISEDEQVDSDWDLNRFFNIDCTTLDENFGKVSEALHQVSSSITQGVAGSSFHRGLHALPDFSSSGGGVQDGLSSSL
ncbi:hypothetical protein LOK49_LG15G01831 [Camellia lanceoleosa]|uniref:Uncharacterized protein n=1 Tax=Camellia lanceoleosa TaxID=1840588 RepID=A0ACC0F769_9ERIC|nr:hypothetical protein LOK49_LG15G01831 [Camellia lanceoleosa]